MNTRGPALASLGMLLFLGLPLAGQEAADVRGESAGTRKRLVDAEQLLQAGKAREARVLLGSILDDTADDLILFENGHSIAARWFGQRLLNRLPAEEWRLAAERNEPAAAALLDDAIRTRNPKPLEAILSRYFVSLATHDALIRLGDHACERGEYALAQRYWRMLTPRAAALERYAGPVKNPAEIEARMLLAMRMEDEASVKAEFERFEREHTNATGWLAGRQGVLAKILREEFATPLPRLQPTGLQNWHTLGGDASRSGSMAGDVRKLSLAPARRVAWPTVEAGPPLPHTKWLQRHGCWSDGGMLMVDNDGLYQLENDAIQPVLNWPNDTVPRNADFTLTLTHDDVLLRAGPAGILADGSELLCVSRRDFKTIRWRLPPPVKAGTRAGWEGAPLVQQGRAYAAYSRLDGGRVVAAIAAIDVQTGAMLFTTDLCESSTGGAENRDRHELLTLAGPNIVFVSQTGVVAAIDAETGKHAWSVRYPRGSSSRYRDFSPAVYSDGRVFVAANDGDRLLALDALTGRTLWESAPMQVDHLIGVAEGKVIAAVAGPQRGLRAFCVRDGSCDFPRGWMQHDDTALMPIGRGAIIGDTIAWPTAAGLYFIKLQDGLPAMPILKNIHGNIAFANGKLAVLAANEVILFETPP